ncbi:DUF2946 family protein [Castellaniella sp.]|uniref:DUF2946 family protein n=1 Tax=Castellaniella sp. TaxID=1955812 RepID=UPI0035667046
MHALRNLKGSHKGVWQILLCLTLFALLFRTAFPAGYMPKLSGPGSGTLTIALCTETGDVGLASVTLLDGVPDHDGAAQSCPFCAVVSQAVMPGAAAPAMATAVARVPTLTLRDGMTPLPARIAGPPLGPRAPPVLLGS